MMLQSIDSTNRSIDMTSESGSTSQDTENFRHIQEILNELRQMQQTPRLVTSPDDLEALEREIRQRTDHLGSLLVGHHLQHALDSTALRAEQEQLVSHWPKTLKNDGKVEVRIRTAQGYTVPVWVTYYRRKGQRRAGKRDAGVYAGLVLLGIYDRCTPALAAEVSLLGAMLGSLDEAQAVLTDRGLSGWSGRSGTRPERGDRAAIGCPAHGGSYVWASGRAARQRVSLEPGSRSIHRTVRSERHALPTARRRPRVDGRRPPSGAVRPGNDFQRPLRRCARGGEGVPRDRSVFSSLGNRQRPCGFFLYAWRRRRRIAGGGRDQYRSF